ncbi:MAG: hypothetical protein BJ554DRAFT_744, partial [Olpidium bornovanus]
DEFDARAALAEPEREPSAGAPVSSLERDLDRTRATARSGYSGGKGEASDALGASRGEGGAGEALCASRGEGGAGDALGRNRGVGEAGAALGTSRGERGVRPAHLEAPRERDRDRGVILTGRVTGTA